MRAGREIISLVADRQDLDQFRRKNWEGTFEEYLDLVRTDPRVTRNAFKRVYDMILSYGTETYEEYRERKTRYRFFSDPDDDGRDAVFGLDASLNLLVNAFKSAARGYGIEKRVLLLHGPVGSSKSTIARLLKKGLGALLGPRRRGALRARLVDRWGHAVVPHERGAAAPGSRTVPRRRGGSAQRRPRIARAIW